VDAAVWYLQLDQFEKDQILESRLYASEAPPPSPKADTPPSFLGRPGLWAPTPGGGSAAAYAGAHGSRAGGDGARLTIGKKKYAEAEAHMQSVLQQAEALRAALTEAVQRDAEAFEAYIAALKLLKDTPSR